MVVGSFTSVSLDPPLVAFFPAKNSHSWPRIEKAGKFCVNILASDQKPLCQQFSSKGANDKFAGVTHRVSAKDRKSVVEGKSGSVRLDLGGRRILKKNKKARETKQ